MLSDEEAKAAKAVAETAGKAVDGAREFGGFISKYIKESLEQGVGIFADKLRYMRWERQHRLMQRADYFLKELGIEAPTRPVAMKIAIPLFQGASLEEDNELQDRWAKLLVNAADEKSGVNVARIYITILEHLSPYEALLLDKIYSVPKEQIPDGMWTMKLPNEIIYEAPEGEGMKQHEIIYQAPEAHEELEIALANLDQLGLITGYMTWDRTQMLRCISQTVLGHSFVNACKLRSEKEAT